VEIEREVCALVPPSEWTALGLRLIIHGRRVCIARSPRCPVCVLNDICPSAGTAGLAPRAAAAARRR
jgi:endonuclease III